MESGGRSDKHLAEIFPGTWVGGRRMDAPLRSRLCLRIGKVADRDRNVSQFAGLETGVTIERPLLARRHEAVKAGGAGRGIEHDRGVIGAAGDAAVHGLPRSVIE